ncbi:unnamed protein product [Paramecium pentaurelia]|uniref:Uncharacterized protein n=1 Tax=Paramecium pentaurelia TaxID=43138 RepID=A0A8S1TTD3_9CILI|nr:unnamed protein product [Paramecium pentaurelia]
MMVSLGLAKDQQKQSLKLFIQKIENYIMYTMVKFFTCIFLQQLRLKNDNQLTQPKIITNLELIKNLKWIGEYGENNQKKGLWQAQLNGQRILRFGGEYSEDGKKQGEWKEILEIQAIVFEVGEYTLDLRKGTWKYVYQDKNIGGGQYNYNGQKNGQWVEIDELFSEPKIRHIGSYKNGKKIGRWDIYQASCKNYLKNWVDMKDNYNNDKSQNGKKVPQFMNNGIEWIKKNIIGGGSYDEVGNGLKLGNWIELWDNFKDNSQITYKGEYKNGKKVGRWDIWFNDGQNKKNIGGGYYDELQHEQKIGNWIEILDISNSKVPILFDGVYQKGKKVGRWNIGFMRSQFYERYGIHSQIDDYSKHLILNNENKNSKDVILDTIGGGQYDETGIKSGIWIELWDNYNDTSQVTYQGGYKNGKKVGRWDIQFNNGKKKKIIGGGYYDELDNGLKSGQWIEVWEGFKENSQVTYIGQYKNEKKIGEWHIWFNSVNRENIGGGSYDEAGNGLKSGIWIELWDNFKDTSSIKYKGEYKNGKKVGRWDIWFNYGKNQKIGGGQYHDAGNRVKLGNWVDVSNDFSDTFQVINKGCYKKGKKVGEWINFMRNENNMNEGLNIISKSQYYF